MATSVAQIGAHLGVDEDRVVGAHEGDAAVGHGRPPLGHRAGEVLGAGAGPHLGELVDEPRAAHAIAAAGWRGVGQPGAPRRSAVEPAGAALVGLVPPLGQLGVVGLATFVRWAEALPAVPAVDLPDVHDLGPATGRADHLPGADEVQPAAGGGAGVEVPGVLHVGPPAPPDDVDDLVQEQRRGGICHGGGR